VTSRRRLIDFLLPFGAIGAAALIARLGQTGDDSAPAFYLAVLGLALATGWLRPHLAGSLGAWLGCSAGVSLGWIIDSSEVWIAGPGLYAVILAAAPHAIAATLSARLSGARQLSIR
jgi:hypothetical protein